MVWFKVDDKFHDHPKAHRAGLPAIGLWSLAGSWAADNVEAYDGFVPERALPQFDKNWKRLAARLVDAGLWEPGVYDGEAGYWYHDWKDQNPTRADVLTKRAEARERMARVRENKRSRSREQTANTDECSREVRDSFALPRPVPSRPDPKEELLLGGQRTETLDPADARCTAHQGLDEPPNCRGCMIARQAAEREIEQRKQDERAARQNCPDCGGSGWLEDPYGKPAGKCTHPKSRRTA